MLEKEPMHTFTGRKNSSTTFCALESSEDEKTPEGINVAFDWVLIEELLVVGNWRFGCLLGGAAGDLINL